MSYAQINNYVANNLAGQVAAYLDPKVANFPNVANYYSQHGYFREATVQAAMFACLKNWITGNGDDADTLLLSEQPYPHFNNRADLVVVYDNGGGPSRLYIELKADFAAASVNQDIGLLEGVAGLNNSPLTDGYAFYVFRNANAGWTNYIDDPNDPDILVRGIDVQ